MKLARGRVVSGKVVVYGEPLQEGMRVVVVVPSGESGFEMSEADRETLMRSVGATGPDESVDADHLSDDSEHR